MNYSKKENKSQDNDIDSKKIVVIICFIVTIIVGFYFYNFHNGLSKNNGVWGTFGDYVGGILNPIIAAFAFYLIAKTYELQKREFEEIRCSQKQQVELAALTALLNMYLLQMTNLESDKKSELSQIDSSSEIGSKIYRHKSEEFDKKINELSIKFNELKQKIESFSK